MSLGVLPTINDLPDPVHLQNTALKMAGSFTPSSNSSTKSSRGSLSVV